MKCEKCNDTGLTLIDIDAPMGSTCNACVEGYCDCEAGLNLASIELCFDCGSHKDEFKEKKLYKQFRGSLGFIYICKICKTTSNLRTKIIDLISKGHNYHCAARMVFGDGNCECMNVFWHTTTGEELPITW